jgi:hypothetical protein
MDDDPACPACPGLPWGVPWERRRCGTFCFCYDPHSEATAERFELCYPNLIPA